MLLSKLVDRGLITPPRWLPDNMMYLVQMGSVAYGVSGVDSDMDLYGYSIPPKDMVFPHLSGEIPGFGRHQKSFEQWSEHHIDDPDKGVQYDFCVYSIVKYFSLVMECNPNMIDSLFVPQRCILHSTTIGEMVREQRNMFLHKGAFHKFKGYAFSQRAKVLKKDPVEVENVRKFEKQFDLSEEYSIVQVRSELQRRKLLWQTDGKTSQEKDLVG